MAVLAAVERVMVEDHYDYGSLLVVLPRRRPSPVPIGDVTLLQWQQELTSAGRLWYRPDKQTRTVWVTKVDLQHPKATD